MTEQGMGRQSGRATARLQVADLISSFDKGLVQGTVVMTADGALPVEYLEPGDRIVTRSGMRVLTGIDTPAPHRFKLMFETPQVIYADGAQVRSDTGLPLAA